MRIAVRSIIPYLMTVACLAALIWAVSFGTLPPADFTFSNGSEIKTVDPAIVTGQPEGRIVRALFEGLCVWDPQDLAPQPGVAHDWELTADKLTYTFHLREDAAWSDGTPLVAEDFVWSFRRFLHPQTGAEYAYEMWYVVGAKQYTTGEVKAGDPVQIELNRKPQGARPFASGILLRGELMAIEGAEATEGEVDSGKQPGGSDKVYVVKVDGRKRRFQKGGRDPGSEDYRWLLYDFGSVGIQATDRHTLRIRLRHPVPYFPNLMGFYPMFPVNRRCVETYGYPAWTKPENIVTNGPFLLKFRRIRDRIRLVKNPHYWDRDNVRTNVIDALAVESYATNLNLYMTGQVDWISAVPPEVIPDLLARPQGDFRPAPYLSTYYYTCNTERPPLDDVRVRRALAMAIDKREIVERVTRAGQKPTGSLVPPDIGKNLDYKPPQCEPYNVEKARALLAEAGYPGGRGFPRIEILYNTSEAHQAIAELIQSQWKRALGIDVGLRNQEWTAYLISRRTGDYYLARAGWTADYVDPNTFLEMFTTGNPNNHTGWGNPEYDRLVELARNEINAQERMRHFQRAERILMDQLPVIPLYSYVTQDMVRPYVKGFYPNILDTHPLKNVWVDRPEKDRVLKAEGLR
ncbi:MAG: hypothetical protein A2V98_03200 [Planctomycetes bacterium RBG_16_64_12]|nr:MAG: hypothetical protein A2V98_03200 [Planctomycetes bacterium RBG_16_64_12]